MGGCLKGFLSIVAIVLVVGVIGSIMGSNKPSTPVSASASEPDFPALTNPNLKIPLPTDQLTIAKSEWVKGGFDSIALVHVTLKNGGKQAVKDVDLTCHFYGPSGTEISTAKVTVFETIGPGKTKRSKELNLGFIDSQVQKAGCEIIAADWA
jgi:hypothetical protein